MQDDFKVRRILCGKCREGHLVFRTDKNEKTHGVIISYYGCTFCSHIIPEYQLEELHVNFLRLQEDVEVLRETILELTRY